ncbi:hypothetical protein D3C85_452190 [compost metagenome]
MIAVWVTLPAPQDNAVPNDVVAANWASCSIFTGVEADVHPKASVTTISYVPAIKPINTPLET